MHETHTFFYFSYLHVNTTFRPDLEHVRNAGGLAPVEVHCDAQIGLCLQLGVQEHHLRVDAVPRIPIFGLFSKPCR